LWDIESGRNTLVNFETGRIQTDRAIQLDTSDDPAHHLTIVSANLSIPVLALFDELLLQLYIRVLACGRVEQH